MKRSTLVATFVLGGCHAGATFVPIDFSSAKTAVLVTSDGVQAHATATSVEALASSTLLLEDFASAEIDLFDEPIDHLRLAPEPEILPEATCPIDQLDTTTARARLCYANGAFAACEPPSRLLARQPYQGEACYQWSIPLAPEGFDLGDGFGTATVLVALGPRGVLAGQIGTSTDSGTSFRILDPSVRPVRAQAPLFTHAGFWSAGALHDPDHVWLSDDVGQLVLVDLATGEIEPATSNPLAVELSALVVSPSDPEVLLATSRTCALLRYDHGEWAVLSPPIADDVLAGKFFCGPEIDWSHGEEALVVGLARGAEQGPIASISQAARRIYRVRGAQITTDSVEWPDELPEGYLRAVGSYRTSDGTWVSLVNGNASHELPVTNGAAKVWFVQDPRLGTGWARQPAELSLDGAAVRRVVAWGDGVMAAGSFLEAFSERNWSAEPLAAVSVRWPLTRVFSRLVPDGRGGVVAGSVSVPPQHFVWMRAN